MKKFHNKSELSGQLDILKAKGISIGFVPTMGALHQGHLALVKQGLGQNDIVVLSIFVNPTQFDNPEDLIKYPRTIEADIALLSSLSETKIIVYAPSEEDIYGNNIVSQPLSFGGLEHEMEGEFRQGHFDGVGTVVKRLLEIVNPDYAYFGEKDFQQLQIIKKLVEIHKIKVKIIACPIYREEDGLALSSRNKRLTEAHRNVSPIIFKVLQAVQVKFKEESAQRIKKWVVKQFKEEPLLELEYFVIADTQNLKPVKRKSIKKTYRAFIAVYAGEIRLIDNIALN